MDDHMQVWAWENIDYTSVWESWVDRVEMLTGHDLDGTQDIDGYSLDTAYTMWQRGLTPIEAYAKIESDKRDLRRAA